METLERRIKDSLEEQIIEDAQNGDTTVLAEILDSFTEKQAFNWLSERRQERLRNNG